MDNQQEQKWPFFIPYIFRPRYDLAIERPPFLKYVVILLIYFGFMIAANLMQTVLFLPINAFATEKFTKFLEDFNNSFPNIWLQFLMVGFIAPLMEELWFRFPLKLYSRKIMVGAYGLISLYIVGTSLHTLLYSAKPITSGDFVTLIFFLIVFGLTIFFATANYNKIEQFYHRYFPFLFWLSVVSFGAIHAFNITVEEWSIPMAYLLFAYAIGRGLIGLILTYARMRHGLLAAILLHMANNSLAVATSAFILLR
ncbi:MAG: type II CAAX prenyl endopeptidase Rce1 family protein [Alphaproteobacteria bacterium]